MRVSSTSVRELKFVRSLAMPGRERGREREREREQERERALLQARRHASQCSNVSRHLVSGTTRHGRERERERERESARERERERATTLCVCMHISETRRCAYRRMRMPCRRDNWTIMITQLARVYSGSMSGNGTCKSRKSLREGAIADADT